MTELAGPRGRGIGGGARRADRPGPRRRAARLLRGAGVVWTILAILTLFTVMVVRLETTESRDDPWEAVAGWESRYNPIADGLAGLLLLSPAFLALRIADRLDRPRGAPGSDTRMTS